MVESLLAIRSATYVLNERRLLSASRMHVADSVNVRCVVGQRNPGEMPGISLHKPGLERSFTRTRHCFEVALCVRWRAVRISIYLIQAHERRPM
jgi:hypothetical protein